MAEKTAIAWTDATFNPWIGCTRVGPGCDHCYAELLDRNRYSHTLGPTTVPLVIGAKPERPRVIHWGKGAPRHRTSPANWKQPLKWNREAEASGMPRRVFCASLADVFDNEVPEEWRIDLFNLIDATPWLRWQLLTKRIANARPYRIPANVWLGITVVNQEEADRDIPKLLDMPVAVRFLSIEPQLGRVDLCEHFGTWWNQTLNRFVPTRDTILPRIDWVINGGESGTHARPFDIEWAWSLKRQCAGAGVAYFPKQLGSHTLWRGCSSPGEHWPSGTEKFDTGDGHWRVLLRDRAGADPAEWPEDLRVREFPK